MTHLRSIARTHTVYLYISFTAFTVISQLLYFGVSGNDSSSRSVGKSSSPDSFVLELSGCKIPEVPLLGEAILPEWNVPFTSNCSRRERVGEFIRNNATLRFHNISKYQSCCYVEVERPNELVSDMCLLSKCFPVSPGLEVGMTTIEFIVVNCTKRLRPGDLPAPETKRGKNDGFYYEFYYHISDSIPRVQKKLAYWATQPTILQPFSVMFLILDSISHTHAQRSLPQTLSYLTESLNFVQYRGYHTVGEPTIENFIPMTLGIPTTHPGWGKKKPSYKGKWDGEPFIWQNYSRSSYITLDTEDMAYWHTLNFNGRTGFTTRPFDYNSRPYFLLQEKYAPRARYRLKYGRTSLEYMALSCVDDKPVWDFLLDFTTEFLLKFQAVPRYSMTWLGWPNHDFLPSAQKFDEPILNFFKTLEGNSSVLDSTVLILMGDHGFRWSNYSEMKEGLLERDLPLFMARLPDRFKEAYPEAAGNFQRNSERITSHLDLFKTLAHLHEMMSPGLGGTYGYNQSYGTSLFKEIPESRTCGEAGIPKEFCSCNFPLWDEPFDFEKYRKSPVVEGLSSLTAPQNSTTSEVQKA